MNEPESLKDKVILVTGSSTGIGAAIAKEVTSRGANVILHGRTESRALQETADELTRLGGQPKLSTADFSDRSELDSFVKDCWEHHGRIDALVNNAGGDVLTGAQSKWDFWQKLDYLLQVDVCTTLFLSRQFGLLMQGVTPPDDSTGAIVNIGWDQAYQGMAGDSGEMFSTTKGAIMSMTKSLAQSLAPKVRVNCVAPGWIKTSWGSQTSSEWENRATSESLMNRWGRPEDVAKAVAYLCGPDSDFISGQILQVNGGFQYHQEQQSE